MTLYTVLNVFRTAYIHIDMIGLFELQRMGPGSRQTLLPVDFRGTVFIVHIKVLLHIFIFV